MPCSGGFISALESVSVEYVFLLFEVLEGPNAAAALYPLDGDICTAEATLAECEARVLEKEERTVRACTVESRGEGPSRSWSSISFEVLPVSCGFALNPSSIRNESSPNSPLGIRFASTV